MSQKHRGGATKNSAGRKPKKKCCVSRPRCTRCPLRMLAEGTLPAGYTVRKRRLVTLDGDLPPTDKKKGKKKHKTKQKTKHNSKTKHKAKRAQTA